MKGESWLDSQSVSFGNIEQSMASYIAGKLQ